MNLRNVPFKIKILINNLVLVVLLIGLKYTTLKTVSPIQKTFEILLLLLDKNDNFQELNKKQKKYKLKKSTTLDKIEMFNNFTTVNNNL